MDAKRSTMLIAVAGGDAAFARLIGLNPEEKGIAQRVNNWKRRGIPAGVVLDNLETIRGLEERLRQTPPIAA